MKEFNSNQMKISIRYKAFHAPFNSIAAIFVILLYSACVQAQNESIEKSILFQKMNTYQPIKDTLTQQDTAIFAAGCFWCVEAQIKQLKGVDSVQSGYIGGETRNPTYQDVSTGKTGHAEACQIFYNPLVISYPELLAAFFTLHDPTQLNRQGNDMGTQYRSAIFYQNHQQKEIAQYYIHELNAAKVFKHNIVTTLEPYTIFYPAEAEHINYFENNPNNPYCSFVIQPELERFNRIWKEKLKSSSKTK